MTREQIKQSVLIAIDETCEAGFSNPNIDNPVDSFLDECAMQVLYTIPMEYIKQKTSFVMNEHSCDSDGCGWVKLPENIIVVTAFKLGEWNKTVCQFHRKGSKTDAIQSNRYLRGGVEKPVVIVDSDKLFYYSATSSTPVIEIAEGVICVNAGEDFPEELVPALVWLCASKVLQVLNDLKASEEAISQYNNLILMFK